MTYDFVAMGASWGGLQAVETVLGGLPAGFRTPIAIAQHRAADSGNGALVRMLSLRSGLQVCEPGDKDAIEPGGVYVAPADYHLLVEPTGFALSTEAVVKYSRPSIDVLLDSAADTFGDRLIAVILTGANEDGADGVKRVKRRGGVTIAQDPSGAARREMPEAAIATGAIDDVLPLEDIGPKLGELVGA